MTPSEAAQILEALARGIDPETGNVFPEDSPLHNAYVVRALYIGAKALGASTTPARATRDVPEGIGHAWQAWTKEEESELLAGFDTGATVEELALAHRRKVGGIRARLVKLGRLE